MKTKKNIVRYILGNIARAILKNIDTDIFSEEDKIVLRGDGAGLVRVEPLRTVL